MQFFFKPETWDERVKWAITCLGTVALGVEYCEDSVTFTFPVEDAMRFVRRLAPELLAECGCDGTEKCPHSEARADVDAWAMRVATIGEGLTGGLQLEYLDDLELLIDVDVPREDLEAILALHERGEFSKGNTAQKWRKIRNKRRARSALKAVVPTGEPVN